MDNEFTEFAWESVYDAVDNDLFRDKDAELIYSVLDRKLRFVSFGRFLQRYLYEKYRLEEDFDSVPIVVYQKLIKQSFMLYETPTSFEPTTARLSALSKNWLTQQSVSRKVVFLLGFGLGMTVDDVNIFLRKALREQGINAKDPFEIICWYCFRHEYDFSKYKELWKKYLDLPIGPEKEYGHEDEMTSNFRHSLLSIHKDGELMMFLASLKASGNESRFSVTARRYFDDLYFKTRKLIAKLYSETETDKNGILVAQYEDAMLRNDHFSDEERLRRVNLRKESVRTFRYTDITESDVEHVLCSSIPTDKHGNLTTSKASRLNAQFVGKRFSRQHIHDILAGRADVTRFDLITLNFFIFSQELEAYSNSTKRYGAFVKSTNEILEDCYMGKLYVTNPYECFILMCILSEDPLGTYADVWERAYQKETE